jgi:hypothetical protein
MAGLFSLISIGNPVGIGVTDSYHGNLKAIIKNNETLKYCISNEFISAEIGRLLGLPIPPCGIVYARGYPIPH